MRLNSNDLMLQAINREIKKYGLEHFRYRLYKRAAECVVEEEYHSDGDIHAVITNQIKEAADFSDETKETFATAITVAIVACRDAPKRRK